MDQQLQQKIAQLKAEISLKERELAKLLKDIEQLQKTKGQAFKDYDAQIKVKKEELEGLNQEAGKTQGFCHLYSRQLNELQIEAEKELKASNLQKERARQEVEQVYLDAEKTKRQAENRIVAVAEREVKADEKEKLIEASIIALQEKQITIDKQEAQIAERIKVAEIAETTSKEAIAKSGKLLDTLDRQIKLKKMQVQNLNTTIDDMGKQAERIGVEAKTQLEKALKLIEEYNLQKGHLDDRDKELNKKEIWLSDREATVGRAYNETIKRGGKIN